MARDHSNRPLLVTGAVFFMLLAGTNLPSPLYAVYQQRFHFSSAVLTLVFATYAIVLVPSLLLFGQLSDRFGRRLVIAGGLGAAVAGLALFAAADGTGWLFAARAMQGVAVGAVSGTATAALVELEPSADRRRAALPSGLAQAGGSALGAVAAGLLAEWAPAPRVLPYLIWIGITVVSAVLVLSLPEPGRPHGEWRIQRPSVPADVRTPFVRASVSAGALWSVAALFLSIVPSYVRSLLGTHDLALVGALSALVLVASCAGQLSTLRPRLDDGRAQLHSLAAVVAGGVLAGLGHGLGFLASQTQINELAPENSRGAVTSAYTTCIYAGVATSVVGVGLLTMRLSLFASVAVFAAAVGSVAIAAACWHLAAAGAVRTRSGRRTAGSVRAAR
jgi:MFS family permease